MTTTPLTRRWRPAPPDPDAALVSELVRALRLPEPLCKLLAGRGYDSPASAKAFLRPTLDELHDPATLADIAPALDRIRYALDHDETILVHGDYDVDGICAATLYTRVLRRLGGRVSPFVPHRVRDGYDLGPGGIRAAVAADARLILTADCGIVAHDAVRESRKAGIDVVITDHHTPDATLPDAQAVVNPRRADCRYPNKALAGTGVAFKLMHALARSRGVPDEEAFYHLDLVALATVADVMPLTGENRVMTRFGLRVLERTRNPGLRALVRTAGLADRRLTAGNLSHGLAPRLNAVGRLEDAGTGLELLLADDPHTGALAAELEKTNARRQAVDRAMLDEAVRLLDGLYDPARDRAVVLAARGWHPGVIGIVASRVVELLHRPALLIAIPDGDGPARGSARSIPGFDLLESVRACGAHLERFGGHAAAAGFDIRTERIDAFREAFGARARELLPDEPRPELRVDLDLPLSDATPELARYLFHAGPFGVGNPTPVFAARGSGCGRRRRSARMAATCASRWPMGTRSCRASGSGWRRATARWRAPASPWTRPSSSSRTPGTGGAACRPGWWTCARRGSVRIIAGRWRGRTIQAPPSGTRPTTDRVREAWMSMMQPEIPDARVLDLFAGSGGLGLETLSRGARHATFVERAAGALKTLRGNVEKLGAGELATIVRADALSFAEKLGADDYDVVVADPPYGSGEAEALARLYLATPFAGSLWIEHRVTDPLPEATGSDTRKYGDTLLTRYEAPE